jgi:prepilin-type processing-associated H-X9-DG protein
MFGFRRCVKLADVTDGTSNTIAMSERRRANFGIGANSRPRDIEGTMIGVGGLETNPGQCLTFTPAGFYADPTQVKGRFGTLWTDGQPERVGFNTVLPPNAPSCVADDNPNADSVTAALAPSSRHAGGVHALMVDGSVRFINENINTGNLALPEVNAGPSPYGVWGALGSKDGGEPMGEF